MAVTRKITAGDIDTATNNLFKNDIPGGQAAGPGTKTEENEKEEKIKITFFVNKSTKDKLQEYCNNNDMTLTAGIKKAIREMLERTTV